MNANHNVNFTSSIEQRLNSVNILQVRCSQVLHDAVIASIISAVEWLYGKFKRRKGRPFAKTKVLTYAHVIAQHSHRRRPT